MATPTPGGWPQWLTTGLQEYAALSADGRIIGQRLVEKPLSAVSGDFLRTQLHAPEPDLTISLALAGYIMHSRRRAQLTSFFDVLRHNDDSSQAFLIACRLPLTTLPHQPLIELRNVRKTFIDPGRGPVPALAGINLTIYPGITALLGT